MAHRRVLVHKQFASIAEEIPSGDIFRFGGVKELCLLQQCSTHQHKTPDLFA